MLTSAPKTIIITTFPSKNYSNLSGGGQMLDRTSVKRCLSSISSHHSSTSPPLSTGSPCPSSVDGDYEFDSQPARKRERLNHLTQDEKIYRRKMKNRMAAQIARDRKKSQMTDLEQRVQLLEHENNNLKHQNNDLASLSARLSAENSRLKSDLTSTHSKLQSVFQPLRNEIVDDGEKFVDDVIKSAGEKATRTANVVAVALGSAESINDLQQQGQATEATGQSCGSSSRRQAPVAAHILMAICSALVTAVSDKSSNGCGDSSRASWAAERVANVLKGMEAAIGRLPINKSQLLNKLDDLLMSRKVTRMKTDPVTLRCAS